MFVVRCDMCLLMLMKGCRYGSCVIRNSVCLKGLVIVVVLVISSLNIFLM